MMDEPTSVYNTIEQLLTELYVACAAHNKLAREYNELKKAREHNAQLIEEQDAKLAQMRILLISETRAATLAEGLLQEAEQRAENLQEGSAVAGHDLEFCLEKRREAENERDAWRRKAQEWGRDTWSQKVIEILRQQLKDVKSERDKIRQDAQDQREAERVCEAMSEMARNRGERLAKAKQCAERAEVLAALVTEETADLLGRLANCTLPNTFSNPYALYRCVNSRQEARILADKIREALNER